ncbi:MULTISPECIES: hypothetical protein [Streptomyces]|uniref:Uncharacterized protein n=1 Tax=Streptomyces pseudovenezuelae TaxID=67350 RepID=A0A124H8C5_9ACTN|nr:MULTISPECIES: hypothetical protein [Streptomyces]KUM82355.1 hypothetical protein AQI94_42005 [Streptomyces pseudovenezuelae]
MADTLPPPSGYVVVLEEMPAFLVSVGFDGHAQVLGKVPRHTVIKALRDMADALELGRADTIIPGGGRG